MALVVCVLGYQFGITMVAPVLPAIARGFDVSTASAGASQTIFFLTGGISSLVSVRLSDRIGRKPVLLGILAAAALGGILIAVAPDMVFVFVGRALQGVASAAFPLTYLILRESLTPQRFGIAVGTVSAFGGGLFGLDGFAGGALGDRLGFRSVFLMLAAVCLIAVLLCWRLVPRGTPVARDVSSRFDWGGTLLLTAALVCLNGGLSLLTTPGSPPALGVILMLIAPLLVVVYERCARGKSDPLVRLTLLRSRSAWPFLLSTLAGIAGAFAVTSYAIAILAEDRTNGYGLSSTLTALFFLTPPVLVALVAAPLAGYFASRIGWSRILQIGLVTATISLIVAAIFEQQMWVVLAAVCGLGLGFNGIVLPMMNGLSVLLSPPSAPGLLPALNGVAVGIGGALGVALVIPMVSSHSAGGYALVFWVCAGLTALASGASFVLRLPVHASALEATKVS
jgi:predicted MFS family arabinose efflux permease